MELRKIAVPGRRLFLVGNLPSIPGIAEALLEDNLAFICATWRTQGILRVPLGPGVGPGLSE